MLSGKTRRAICHAENDNIVEPRNHLLCPKRYRSWIDPSSELTGHRRKTNRSGRLTVVRRCAGSKCRGDSHHKASRFMHMRGRQVPSWESIISTWMMSLFVVNGSMCPGAGEETGGTHCVELRAGPWRRFTPGAVAALLRGPVHCIHMAAVGTPGIGGREVLTGNTGGGEQCVCPRQRGFPGRAASSSSPRTWTLRPASPGDGAPHPRLAGY